MPTAIQIVDQTYNNKSWGILYACYKWPTIFLDRWVNSNPKDGKQKNADQNILRIDILLSKKSLKKPKG
jgi:hypothetical protein